MNQEFRQIIAELKKPFPPEAHVERPLPGGGRWLYIKWQDIRERLDEVYPEWSCSWTEPTYIDNLCVISCTITIAGVSRQAPGNAEVTEKKSRGTAVERAIADAFKNCCEAYGVGRYLDDQVFTANYLSKKGDMRAYKFATENAQIEAGARGNAAPVKPKVKESSNLLEAVSSEAPAVPNHNNRVKAVRELLNCPKELAIDWLRSKGKTSFDGSSKQFVDEFVAYACISWASNNSMNPHHAKRSYEKRVVSPSASAMKSEVELIADWMEYVRSIKLEDKDLIEAPAL